MIKKNVGGDSNALVATCCPQQSVVAKKANPAGQPKKLLHKAAQ
jgi:hypothetical protein